MKPEDRLAMVAACGIDCGNCNLYLAGDNRDFFEALKKRGIPEEKLPCPGCRKAEGHCPVIGEQCATYQGVADKGVRFCHECGDFPCGKLNPASDRAQVLPHNLKVFNLCSIRARGLERFVEESGAIEAKYFKGKMEIGKGPRL